MKIKQAIDIVNNRLPKSYLVQIKLYKTVYNMQKANSKYLGWDYKKTVNWYTEYLENPKLMTYKTTKYYPMSNKSKHRISGFNAVAIGGDPILICYEVIKDRPLIEHIFLILHEIAHVWLDRRGYNALNENWCDEFAIRWTRKFKKEGLI